MTAPTQPPNIGRGRTRLRGASWGWKLLLLGAMVAAGFLFGVAGEHARHAPSTLGLDLPQLVKQRQADIELREEALLGLVGEINMVVAQASTSATPAAEEPWATRAVSGPGMRVELFDAPAEVVTDGRVAANDLVVHQQDVDAVMNALWRGGAEAMAIQGLRISSSTPVRCIGNVILVGGSSFAPPYRIDAIGDPQALAQALEEDPQIQIYRQYVDAYGIGWKTETLREVTIPPLSDGYSFRHARTDQGPPQ